MREFEIQLTAIRGKQANRYYYLVMCPLKDLPRLLPLPPHALPPDSPFLREPDKGRVAEIGHYVAQHKSSYTISAITCVVDRDLTFEPFTGRSGSSNAGILYLPLSARILILDGLHRRKGVEAALEATPEIADDTLSIVLYVDPHLDRSEQTLSDLRRNATRSARSQGIYCDQRDDNARIARELTRVVDIFSDMTEMTRSTISNRSLKLFTLSAIYHATEVLLSGKREETYANRLALAAEFWSEVARHIPDWQKAKSRSVSPAQLRQGFVHAHAIALAALARAGKTLLEDYPDSWKRRLKPLRTLNWSRSNTALWEGRAMIAGRLSKSNVSVVLTGNAIKQQLRLPLTEDELDLENRKSGKPH